MNLFFEEYLNRIKDLHAEVWNAIKDLPQDALDFKPSEDIPSICVLVVHLTGAERYWIGDVVGIDPSNRDRDAEFRSRDLSATQLQELLETSTDYAHQLLSSLNVEGLSAMRVSSRDNRQFSVAWALLHALEHTAIHLGHIQIIRQLWYQDHP